MLGRDAYQNLMDYTRADLEPLPLFGVGPWPGRCHARNPRLHLTDPSPKAVPSLAEEFAMVVVQRDRLAGVDRNEVNLIASCLPAAMSRASGPP